MGAARGAVPPPTVAQQQVGGLVRQRSIPLRSFVAVPGFTGNAGDGVGSVHRYVACRGVEWGFQCKRTNNLPFRVTYY